MPILPINPKYPQEINSLITRSIMFHPDNKMRFKEYATASIHKAFVVFANDVKSNTIQGDPLPEMIERLNERFLKQFHNEKSTNKNVLINLTNENKNDDALTFLSNLLDPKNFVEILLNAPPFENLEKEASKKSIGGGIAGDILLYLFRQKNIGIKPSIGKAQFLLEQALLLNRKHNEKIKIPFSIKSFKNSWKRFRPVSHLWAALKYIILINEDKDYQDILNSEIFDHFLALAECFRKFGEETISERVDTPIFNKNELWAVPEDYPLPNTEPDIKKDDEWLLKILKEYSVESVK